MLEKRPYCSRRNLGCSFSSAVASLTTWQWCSARNFPHGTQTGSTSLKTCRLVPASLDVCRGKVAQSLWQWNLNKMLKTDLRIQLPWPKMYTSVFLFLKLFFEDEEKEALYEVVPDMSLLKVLQHKRYCIVYFTDNSIHFATCVYIYVKICFDDYYYFFFYRYFVKAGSPSFIVLVKGSAFSIRYLTEKTIKRWWRPFSPFSPLPDPGLLKST